MTDSHQQPVVNVSGERLAIGPWQIDLIDTYLRWFNDLTVARTLNHPRQITRRELVATLESQEADSSVEGFTIYKLDGWQPIGNAALTNIDFRDRTAEFEIVIGAGDARGQGYGTEATRLVLDHAFSVLSLRNVMLKVYASNLAGIRAYQKAGFREFGCRQQATEVNGQAWDVIYMECLRDEFDSPVLAALFAPDQPR